VALLPVGMSGERPVSVRSILRWAVVTAFEAAWAPLLVVAVHAVAIVGWNAYGRFPALDVPMHFAGGMAIAYFFHRAARNAARFGLIGPFGTAGHLLRVGAATLAAAVAWEVAEFALDRTFGTHTQPGPVDTLGDLLLGALGGVTCLAGVVANRRRRGVGPVDTSSFRD